MTDTRQKILDTAERLIGEHGYAATSLRSIIAEAGVNLAAIHYHFGSKDELLGEIIGRKVGPVNEERLARLDRLEAAAAKPDVTAILEAFLEPMAEAADRDPGFVRLMGRMLAEGLLPAIAQKHFQPTTRRMLDALRRALPGLPDEDFVWRAQFMAWAMAHTMCANSAPLIVETTRDTFRERIDRLIAFSAGGFLAPARAVAPVEVNR